MRIAVQGRSPLRGDYYPSTYSNAALVTIAASMLTDVPTTWQQMPATLSVGQMLKVAQNLGAKLDHESGSSLRLQTSHIQSRVLDSTITDEILASVLFLAPIIARRRHVRLEWLRPLQRLHVHLSAMRDLGLVVNIDNNMIEINAETWDTRELVLPWPSVTATALVCMLAAVLGRKTTLYNAASEPHLRTLQHQLVQLGTKIEGIGSNLVTIYGNQNKPEAVSVDLPPDHIEIASITAMAAMTDGQVAIHNVNLPDLRMILKVYESLGIAYFLETQDNRSHILHVPEQRNLQISPGDTLTIDTSPWPGFPSDLVAIATVVATQARGTTLIHEKLFDNRLLFTDKIKAMGGQIVLCDPHRAVVFGKSHLHGEYIDSPDVRVGLALLAAALCADGESIIDNAQLVDWVFEDIVAKLKRLGAQIEVSEL